MHLAFMDTDGASAFTGVQVEGKEEVEGGRQGVVWGSQGVRSSVGQSGSKE